MKQLNLGHQTPKEYRTTRFNSIEFEGDFRYCVSHNFVYNSKIEKEKLYNALPCYYTDKRFFDGPHNYYKQCMLHWTRWKDISLKACIRKTLKCRNIPVGTIVKFGSSYCYHGKKFHISYLFKVKKENKLDIKFEISDPEYFQNFTTCEFSKNLTDALRNNGFIVQVDSHNNNFISSMISTAASYLGKNEEIIDEDGETAIAYGYGKKIGFSSGKNNLFGYSNGCENILYDMYGEFDNWSTCAEIPKTTPIEEIVEILKSN